MRTHFKSLTAGVFIGLILLVGCSQGLNRPEELTTWPEGKTPEDIGKKLAENILPRLRITRRAVHYCEDSMWVYMAKYAKLTKDKELMDKVIGQFGNMLTEEGRRLISMERHVDHTIFGIVPLELYIQTKDKRYLEMGKMLADRQWEFPDANGLSGETRFWIDDMYMITILQVQAYRATGDKVYLDRAALEMEAYLDKLQRPNGLFYHEPAVPFFWGRGNGWVAGGMTELLSVLPKDHPKYERIMQGYLKMMSSLLKYQGDDGMWHQLIDHPESFKESSGTAMFTFAMIQGVKDGRLKDKAYAQAARKGWLALTERVDDKGNLSGVCVGTSKLNDLQYYLNRPTRNGDAHGQEALIWCVVALLE
ncbi:MAG: glycoside hydrolase family 88 protein [Sedimentisphaerales bacterium]|nr:glycoside hydrolase family 88 protein [Sedimentisphaerales bacterium]